MSPREREVSGGRAGRILQAGLLAVLVHGLPGCANPADVDIVGTSFNERLRPDRQALTVNPDQIGQPLHVGTYSTHEQPDRIVSEIYPVMKDGNASRMPVSECLWIGTDGAQGNDRDMLRLHWEAIYNFDPSSGYTENLVEGDHDVGMCRFDDPVSRVPPRDKRDESGIVREHSTSELPLARFNFTFQDAKNWPRFLTDLIILEGRLTEWTTGALPPFGQCPDPGTPFQDAPLAITNANYGGTGGLGVSFFNGPSDEDGSVSLCTPMQGYQLSPARAARYQVSVALISGGDQPHWLQPTIMVAPNEVTIARPMAPAQAANPPRDARTWSTPSTGGGNSVRWQENFTEKVHVESVRFFKLVDGVPVYQAFPPPADPPPLTGWNGSLCLDADQSLDGCRWLCSGALDPQTGATYFPLLGGGSGCRSAAQEGIPVVTPTYVVSNLAAGLSAPMLWGIEHSSPDELWIEFKLRYAGALAGLRAEPPLADLGRKGQGSLSQGTIEVYSFGGPIRIESVSLVPGSGATGDFSVMVPGKPQSIPLPIDVTPVGPGAFKIKKGSDWGELERLVLIQERSRHTLLRPASLDGEVFSFQGEPIRMQGGIALLERPDARLEYTPDQAAAMAGTLRPVRKLAYPERTPPFELLGGETFPILVSARPQGTGDRVATVRVEGRSITDPSAPLIHIEVQVKVFGLTGPEPVVTPSRLDFPVLGSYSPGRRWKRNLLVLNNGDQPLTVSSLTIDAGPRPTPGRFTMLSSNAGGFVLGPGQSELVEVEHSPFCPVVNTLAAEAVLNVRSSAGDYGVPLSGTPSPCSP